MKIYTEKRKKGELREAETNEITIPEVIQAMVEDAKKSLNIIK